LNLGLNLGYYLIIEEYMWVSEL